MDLDDDELTMGELAMDLFKLYISQHEAWSTRESGAVSSALSAFFEACDPQQPTMLHWARWLRIEHENETGVDLISVGALTHSAPALDISLDFKEGAH